MKSNDFIPLAALAAALLTDARADYATAFENPPFQLDAPVAGSDGWEPRLPTLPANPDGARVVKVRWNDYRPAAMLKGANLKKAFPPTTAGNVTVRIELALAFSESGPPGKPFRLGFDTAPFGELFFDPGPSGGLGYRADGSGRGGVIVLPRSELRVNAFYAIKAAVDFAKSVVTVEVTGQRKDGSPFVHRSEPLPFEARRKSIGSLYLITSGSITAYLGAVSVKGQ